MCVTPPSPKYNCYTPCLWRIHKRPSAYKRLRKPCLLVLSQRRLALKVSVDSHIILRKCKILPTSLRIINWNIITEAFTHIILHKHYIYILCRPDILLQDIYCDIVQNSWFHQLWQVIQVLKLQSSPRPSHCHHHVWLLVWCSFYEMLCWFYARHNQLLSHQSTEYLPKSLGDNQDNFFDKCETSFLDLFGQQWLLPWISPMNAVFAQSLSYCWIVNTDLNWGKWDLQFFRCCSGFFYDLLDESLLRSRSYFGRPATPGKVHHCSKFSPFVYNGSDRGSPEFQRLINGFIPLSRLIHVNYFVLICSWISLDRGMMCCSLSMLYFARQLLFKNLFNCHCPTGGLTCHWCAGVHLKNLHHNTIKIMLQNVFVHEL